MAFRSRMRCVNRPRTRLPCKARGWKRGSLPGNLDRDSGTRRRVHTGVMAPTRARLTPAQMETMLSSMSDHPSIGEFEELVLLSILHVGEGAYGVPILKEIRRRTGRKVLRPAVYVALRRLEDKGMVAVRTGEARKERGGRGRKFYRMEPGGMEALRQSRRTRLSMWDGLEAVLDEG